MKNESVVIQKHKKYISSFSKEGINFTPNILEAYVFENRSLFKTLMDTYGFSIEGYSFMDAKAAKGTLEKNFVLKQIEGKNIGYYLEKIEDHKIYLTKKVDIAKGFDTEKSAKNYIHKKLIKLKSKYIIEPVKEEN